MRKRIAALGIAAAVGLTGIGIGTAEAHDTNRKHPHINVRVMDRLLDQPASWYELPDGTRITTPNGKALVRECFADVTSPYNHSEIRQVNACMKAWVQPRLS